MNKKALISEPSSRRGADIIWAEGILGGYVRFGDGGKILGEF